MQLWNDHDAEASHIKLLLIQQQSDQNQYTLHIQYTLYSMQYYRLSQNHQRLISVQGEIPVTTIV